MLVLAALPLAEEDEGESELPKARGFWREEGGRTVLKVEFDGGPLGALLIHM